MNALELGELLKKARQDKRKKLKTAAAALKVREEYLQMIEDGDIETLQAQNVFIFGYLKSYIEWLGLNGEELMLQMRDDPHLASIVKADRFRPVTSHAFSEDESFGPGMRLILMIAALIAAAYGLWYLTLAPTPASLSTALIEPAKQAQEKRMILLAREAAEVTLLGEDKEIILQRTLQAGDTVFLVVGPTMELQTDKPEQLDVFLDDANNTFLGSLDKVMP